MLGKILFRNGRSPMEDACYLKTAFWNYRYKLYSFPIILYPEMYFRIGSNANIIHNKGRLRLGRRWNKERFRESEFVISDNGTLEINDNFDIYTGSFITIAAGAKLTLGKGGINRGVTVTVFNSISIGDNVYISDHSTLRDSDNHCVTGGAGVHSAPINIGNNVWIGINVTILKGVTIGDGAVIAANSLVNKSVPPHTLVGGVPAKVIRENVRWNL